MESNHGLKKNRKGTEYIEVDNEVIAKRCSVCGEIKELEYFINTKKGFARKHSRCKACAMEYRKKYEEENREKVLKDNRDWARKYREKNRELLNERAREYTRRKREENKDTLP